MSTNKSISYILCNKGIIVNLYKLHFSSFSFSLQPNKRVFHPPTFSPLQPNTQEGKLNILHPPTIFYPLTFPLLQPNRALEILLTLVWYKFQLFRGFFFFCVCVCVRVIQLAEIILKMSFNVVWLIKSIIELD